MDVYSAPGGGSLKQPEANLNDGQNLLIYRKTSDITNRCPIPAGITLQGRYIMNDSFLAWKRNTILIGGAFGTEEVISKQAVCIVN